MAPSNAAAALMTTALAEVSLSIAKGEVSDLPRVQPVRPDYADADEDADVEEFVDEAALAEHSADIADAIAPLLAASQIVHTGVLGEVSDERRESMTGPHTDFMGAYAGFRR